MHVILVAKKQLNIDKDQIGWKQTKTTMMEHIGT